MMNLFENLQNINEIAMRQENVDDYFDNLIIKIQNKYNCDVDDTYYDVDNWPEEFKARFVLYNINDDNDIEDIKKIILDYCNKFKNININVEFDSNYTNDFIETAYVFEIKANNENDLWNEYNEELKLNENEELFEVKLSNEEGILTDDDEKELNKIGEEVTNDINELIQNKDKLAKLLPKYVDDLNNEFNIRAFIGDEIDTHDWLYSEGLIDKDDTLVYENVMTDEINSIKDGGSGYTAQDLYKEYNMAKSNVEYWMNKIKDIDKD